MAATDQVKQSGMMAIEDTISRQTHGALGQLMGRQTFWVFVAAVLAFIYLSFASDTFFTPKNLFNVARNCAFVGIIALGMTAVIITGGIDLSVGSILCLAGMVVGMMMSWDYSIWFAAPLALGAALADRLRQRLPDRLCRHAGLRRHARHDVGRPQPGDGAVRQPDGLPVRRRPRQARRPRRRLDRADGSAGSPTRVGPDTALGALFLRLAEWIFIPNPAVFLAVLALVFGFLFRWTRWGRHIFAIGGNEQAATLTGVPVRQIKVSVYMLSALMAGIAGILQVGWLGTITTGMGTGMELVVIAAVVIGGANLAGGSGTAFGAVVGAVLIEMIRNSLTLLGINPFWQGTFIGTFIIIAVLFDRIRACGSSD